MNEINHDTETLYFKHIGKQLFKNSFSDVKFDVFFKNSFQADKNHQFKDVFEGNDLYMQILAELANQNLNYYLKNLEINVDERNYKVINLKYDYYNKNEIVLKTNIKFNIKEDNISC